jgi:uncharacterized membrane protein
MVGVSSVLAESWRIYRLLLRRSLIAAGAVFLIVDGVYVASYRTDDRAGHIALTLLSLLLSIAGPVLVQAALVVPVEALHAGERPVGMAASLRRALGRLRTLVAVVIVYGLGVFFGFPPARRPGLARRRAVVAHDSRGRDRRASLR